MTPRKVGGRGRNKFGRRAYEGGMLAGRGGLMIQVGGLGLRGALTLVCVTAACQARGKHPSKFNTCSLTSTLLAALSPDLDLCSSGGPGNDPTALNHAHPMEGHLYFQVPLPQAAPELAERDLQGGGRGELEAHDMAGMSPQADIGSSLCLTVAGVRQDLGRP